MSTTVAEDELIGAPARPAGEWPLILRWLGMLLGLSVVVGGLSALFWVSVVDLPHYEILRNGRAVISERSWTQVISADAWFTVCGVLVGVGVGIISWRWFSRLGWPTAFIAAGAGLVAGVVCWQLGQVLGPGPWFERVALASVGDEVPFSLELRAMSALAVWAFAAVAPVLLAASLGPEQAPTVPERELRLSLPGDETEIGTVDERGVVTQTSPHSP